MSELIQTVERLRDEMVAYAFSHNSDDMFDVATDLTRWIISHRKRGDFDLDLAG